MAKKNKKTKKRASKKAKRQHKSFMQTAKE